MTAYHNDKSCSVILKEVVKVLIEKNQYKEEEALIICNKFQAKLGCETLDSSTMTIDDLRVQHWEDALQEVRQGDHKKVAMDCYTLWKTRRLQLLTMSENTKDMLCELRKSTRLVLLTNGVGQVQREKIESCGAQQFFDAVVVGGEHAEEKPAPSIFYHCCDLIRVLPGDCVMVGDNLDTDIQGGLNAGLKATIWLNKNPSIIKVSPTPHYTVKSVMEVPDVLKNVK
ncbi:hypothetical protein XENTR_v10013604 [Xenopus tropicalis]|uniref:N-acetylneuraminic acid phosphatase n=1 Tax=Xenopus tropicalis TaxID=8364 RepID=A0A803JQ79_XENTR|nr:N-acylneuraminate-9-phosphatase isoform X1 [Xenopus tropicalis]KAE8601256.1 hypothetical protein XENTR_v10013604 [Xenopus tropicalis]